MKEKIENYESRNFAGTIEIRQTDDGKTLLEGVAAIFDTLSENLGGFREQILPGAFDETDRSDVRGLFNHDSNFVLGRSKSDTLVTKITDRGLEYRIEIPDTQTIRDLVLEPIKRGDVDQSSFGFMVAPGGSSFDEDEEGRLIRTISAISRLFDVSPVTFPAYADTTVGTRGLSAWKEHLEHEIEEATRHAEHKRTREHFLRATELPGA